MLVIFARDTRRHQTADRQVWGVTSIVSAWGYSYLLSLSSVVFWAHGHAAYFRSATSHESMPHFGITETVPFPRLPGLGTGGA